MMIHVMIGLNYSSHKHYKYSKLYIVMAKILNHFVMVILIVISPALTYSADKNLIADNTALTSSTINHKTSGSAQARITEIDINHPKTTLNDDSRGLSGFFLLGIIINIIMIITFGWWFSKEWHRLK